MFVKQKVQTPYGNGFIKEIRPNDIVVQPTAWALANDQKPVFYMNPKDVKPLFAKGDLVSSVFGTGKIIDIRENDGIYVITAMNWLLADGKSPTFFMNDDSFKKLPPTEFEIAWKKAAALKEEAKAQYVQKKFAEAKILYAKVIDTIRVTNSFFSLPPLLFLHADDK